MYKAINKKLQKKEIKFFNGNILNNLWTFSYCFLNKCILGKYMMLY